MGVLLIGPSGQLAGPVCAAMVAPAANQITTQLHDQIFEWQIDPDAQLVGAIVGTIPGSYVAIPLVESTVANARRHGFSLFADSFDSYSRQVRRLTETTMGTRSSIIDPARLRSSAHHLHHRIPIKCGWVWGIPAWVMASGFNLQMLPAAENLAIGANGC